MTQEADDTCGDPILEKLVARLCDALEANCHADAAAIATENPEYRQCLEQVAQNYWAARPKDRAKRLLVDQPEFDGYKLEKILGEGGCSVVFQAVEQQALADMGPDVRDLAQVAIKVFTRGVSSGAVKKEYFLSRELPEVSAVPKIHKYGTVSGFPYLAMDLVEGMSLAARLSPRRKLSRVQSRSILIGICRAMAEISQSSKNGLEIVHGDIKPQNIMLNARGQITVLDFGIAMLRYPQERHLRPSDQGTLSRMAGYTPDWASPELLLARDTDLPTPASDVFQIGLVGFRMLTARHYWSTPSGERKKCLDDSMCGGHLRHIIERALNWDPSKRYQTPRDMLSDLTRRWHRRMLRSQFLLISASVVLAAGLSAAGMGAGWLSQMVQAKRQNSALEQENQRLALANEALNKTADQGEFGKIRAAYELFLKSGDMPRETIELRLAELQGQCRQFLRLPDGKDTKLLQRAQQILDYASDAGRGVEVTVRPVRMEEYLVWRDANMKYELLLNGQPLAVIDGMKVNATHRFEGAVAHTFRWRPFDRIELRVHLDSTHSSQHWSGAEAWRDFATSGEHEVLVGSSFDGKLVFTTSVDRQLPTLPPSP